MGVVCFHCSPPHSLAHGCPHSTPHGAKPRLLPPRAAQTVFVPTPALCPPMSPGLANVYSFLAGLLLLLLKYCSASTTFSSSSSSCCCCTAPARRAPVPSPGHFLPTRPPSGSCSLHRAGGVGGRRLKLKLHTLGQKLPSCSFPAWNRAAAAAAAGEAPGGGRS